MSRIRARLYFQFVAVVLAVQGSPATRAADISVAVQGRSEPEVCAEKDNVRIDIASPLVRRFQIAAVHPSFIGMIGRDRYQPDYTSCAMKAGEEFAAGTQRVTFFETPRFWLVGYRLPDFWRPADVAVRVGPRVERGFALVQFWVRHRERAEEVLVVYPPDGYWRMRPLPPGDMRWSAYGTSFLIGPLETADRPVVALDEIAFDEQARAFTLRFRRGGSARVAIADISEDRIALDVTLDADVPRDTAFASLRSMYATQDNADASRIAWRDPASKGWAESPVMDFAAATASEIWLGRHVASRHNLSAPDMVLNKFNDQPGP